MADEKLWPEHLCGHTLAACQRKWLHDSGLHALLIGVPRGTGAPHLRPGDSMPPLAWPAWPLAIGRKALDEDAARHPDPKPLELARARPALPFDGHERALFAARVVTPTVTLDFFGLGRTMLPAERLALSDPEGEALGDEQVYIIGGDSTVILGGPDAGRLRADNAKRVSTILRSARRWWAKLDGQRVGAGGRPEGSTSPDPTFADRFYKALRSRYADGFRDRPSQESLAENLCVSVDTLQRRINGIPLPWPPPWPPE